jgi:hypothetical protein
MLNLFKFKLQSEIYGLTVITIDVIRQSAIVETNRPFVNIDNMFGEILDAGHGGFPVAVLDV